MIPAHPVTPARPAGTFTPAPGRAPRRTVLASQTRMELVLTVRRAEAAVLALGVPLLVLLGAGLTTVTTLPTDDRIGYVAPGVLALTVISTAFTGQAISTGYERSYGVLKRLGASPLTRGGLLTAKIAAIGCLVLAQSVVLAAVAVAVGWRPSLSHLPAAVAVTLLAVAAYSGFALVVASVLRPETTTGLATLIYVLMLALGGVMFPTLGGSSVEVLLMPLAAHAEALRSSLTAGTGVPLLDWAGLSLWALAGVATAARVFRWE
jgi:ABC-2 type transport system permease protein